MLSTPLLLGCGIVAWSVGALMIHLSPWTKVKDPVTGITTITEKATGRRWVIMPGGYPREL